MGCNGIAASAKGFGPFVFWSLFAVGWRGGLSARFHMAFHQRFRANLNACWRTGLIPCASLFSPSLQLTASTGQG